MVVADPRGFEHLQVWRFEKKKKTNLLEGNGLDDINDRTHFVRLYLEDVRLLKGEA